MYLINNSQAFDQQLYYINTPNIIRYTNDHNQPNNPNFMPQKPIELLHNNVGKYVVLVSKCLPVYIFFGIIVNFIGNQTKFGKNGRPITDLEGVQTPKLRFGLTEPELPWVRPIGFDLYFIGMST